MNGPMKSASTNVSTRLDLQCLQLCSELFPTEPAHTIKTQAQRLAELLQPFPSPPAEEPVLKPRAEMLFSAPPSDPASTGPVMALLPGCIDGFSFDSDKHAGCSTPSTASDAGSQDLSYGHMSSDDTCNSTIPAPRPKNSTKVPSDQILAGCDATPLPTLLLGLWKKTGDNGKVLQSLRCRDSKAFRPPPGHSDPEPKAFRPPPGLSDPEPQRECTSSQPQQKICPVETTSISAALRLPFDICRRKESPFIEDRMHKTIGGSHPKDDRGWRLVNRKITDPQDAAQDSKCAEQPCRDAKRWRSANRRLPGPQLVTASKSFFLWIQNDAHHGGYVCSCVCSLGTP